MFSSLSLRRLSFASILILVVTFGLRELHTLGNGYANFPKRQVLATDASVPVSIPAGATGSKIGQLLVEAGVVASTESFFRAAVANPKAKAIAPGTHTLSIRIDGATAVEQLLDLTRIVNLIKISEGAWNSEVFAEMKASKVLSESPGQSAVQVVLPKDISSLEGVLFPAQYSFADGTSQLQALQSMVDKFTQVISGLDFNDPYQKLSTQQLVTLASLVQAEGDTKDFSKIARVIRNRLSIGMPLQLDSTIHYLKKTRGQIYLSTSSTKLKSPFNTYQSYGLPPAPIGNPGLAALKAVITPVEGNWLFFITVAPGDTRFTKSNSEFNSWKLLYEKNRKAGAFK
jgi:UPF0755 protein